MCPPFYRLFNALRPLRNIPALAGIVLIANTQVVLGADASNGKTLYNYALGGIACSNAICHGTNPSANLNSTITGSNNPGKIGNAITNNAGGTMGAAVKFTTAQLADIAAYIANPTASTPTAPAVSVSPAAIGFPSTTVGQTSSTQSVVVSNTGTAALVVASLGLSGVSSSDYSIAGSSCISGGTVAVAASCTVSIAFKPSAAGTRSASVDIVHNAVAAVSTISLTGVGAASTGTAVNLVVEYYHSGLDHYFVSANPAEIAGLDANPALGWQRTGTSFKSGGSIPVCRFYGSVSPGPNSHFFTVSTEECESLKAMQASTPMTEKRWNFEGLDFSSTVPAFGTCPNGTNRVHRAYNNGNARGVDSNHRISSSVTAIEEVVARGWVDEGAVMCAPQ